MQIHIKATLNAKQDKVIKEVDMFGQVVYKVYTTKPPEDNKANKAVIELIAKYFKTSKSKVKLVRGEKSRNKVFEISLQ